MASTELAAMCEARAQTWRRADDAQAQFLTPLAIAQYMASQLTSTLVLSATPTPKPSADPTPCASPTVLRVLDPGAGLGILAASFLDALRTMPHLEDASLRVELVLVELDEHACRFLKETFMEWVAASAQAASVTVDVRVIHGDFLVLAEAWVGEGQARFDVVLTNPPYSKVSSNDLRVVAAAARFGRQSNAYSLFLSYAAELLRPGGALVCIVPRSFTASLYFAAFRGSFLSRIAVGHIHGFVSRTETFQRDDVLQETVILCGQRRLTQAADPPTIKVSWSRGTTDLAHAEARPVPASAVLWAVPGLGAPIVRLPRTADDDAIVALFDRLPCTLAQLGLHVGTGRALAYRCTAYSAHESSPDGDTMPYIWMEHVHPLRVVWPVASKSKHPQHFSAEPTPAVSALTVPLQPMVLVRRFSANEQLRRLVVAPLLTQAFAQYPRLALENHVQYIYSTRPNGLDDALAVGLAAFLSSALVDTFFRVVSGNTQVSAYELGMLRLPSRPALHALGQQVAPFLVGAQGKQDDAAVLGMCDSLVALTQPVDGGGERVLVEREVVDNGRVATRRTRSDELNDVGDPAASSAKRVNLPLPIVPAAKPLHGERVGTLDRWLMKE